MWNLKLSWNELKAGSRTWSSIISYIRLLSETWLQCICRPLKLGSQEFSHNYDYVNTSLVFLRLHSNHCSIRSYSPLLCLVIHINIFPRHIPTWLLKYASLEIDKQILNDINQNNNVNLGQYLKLLCMLNVMDKFAFSQTIHKLQFAKECDFFCGQINFK